MEVKVKEIYVYPNPAKDVNTFEGYAITKIELLNLQGQVLQSLKAFDAKTLVDVSTVSEGVYSLKIKTKDGAIVKNVLKK